MVIIGFIKKRVRVMVRKRVCIISTATKQSLLTRIQHIMLKCSSLIIVWKFKIRKLRQF